MAITWTKQTIGTFSSDMDYNANFFNAQHSWDYTTLGVRASYMGGTLTSYNSGTSWGLVDGLYIGCVTDDNYIYGTLPSDDISITRLGFVSRYNITTQEIESFYVTQLALYSSFYSISSNSNGQYVVAVVGTAAAVAGTNIGAWISRDYGETWSSYLTHGYVGVSNIFGNHVSENGDNMAMFMIDNWNGSVYSDTMYYSSDYGNNWSAVYDTTTEIIRTSCTDSTCTNMVLGGSLNTSSPYTYGVVVTHDSGATWHSVAITSGTSYPYGSLACSKDGAVVIYNTDWNGCWISTDYGETWTERFPWGTPRKQTTIRLVSVMKADGSKIWTRSIANDQIVESLDFGVTWNVIKPYVGLPIIGSWIVGMNDDGTKKIVVPESAGNEYIYQSSSENIWTSGSPISGGEWATASISGDGNYIIIGQYYGRLYLSDDSGSTWNEIRPSGIDEDLAWYGSAISLDGKYITAGDYINDDLYLSENYGLSWSKIVSGVGCADRLAMSSDGSFMIGVGWETIETSKNYGVSWTDTSSGSSNWTAVDCSSSGSVVYAVRNGYDVYYSDNSGDDWTAIIDDEYGYDISCSGDGGAYILADGITGLFSHGYTSGSVIYKESVTNPKSTDMNSAGTSLIVGQALGYVYVGIGVLVGGRIKSIAGILFENISKVAGVPIASLKKISGEEN